MTSKEHLVLQTGKKWKYPYFIKMKCKNTEDKIFNVSIKRPSLKW